MRARLVSAHFWAADEAVAVKHTDLAAFRYESKKPSTQSVYRDGKKLYVEKRNQTWALSTKRPYKLKDCFREFSELLKEHRLIYSSWHNDNWLCFMFSTGTIVYIAVNTATGDITRILFDRYLVGKLLSSNVCEALFTETHILLTYNDNQAILVNFNKPSIKNIIPEKLSKRDPKFQTIELVGGWRRGGRQVSGSVGGGYALVWSRASPSDLFPWSPRAVHEDHANVHVYSFQGSQMSLQCYHRIEFDPICVSFSKINEKVIYSVEQKTSRKGGVIVESKQLEINNGNDLEESQTIRVAAPAPATCAVRSPCEFFLLLTCSDRSILLHHYLHNITTTVTAAFIARNCCWWQDSGGSAIVVGGVGAQLQCWDTALSPIHLAPVSDHLPSSSVLDLSSYFRKEPTMINLLWNHHQGSRNVGSNGFLSRDGLILAIMQNGPLVCIRIHEPSTFQGDEGGGGPVFLGSESTAVARLRTMDWTSQGTSCLALLHRIINSLFSRPLNNEREDLAQAALGTFLAPVKPHPSSVRMAHLPQLHDLCRRFFHHLMRFGRLEKAFSLAIDVGHHDLFLDLKYAAEAIGADDIANEATIRAEDALSSCESSCSRTCSHCSSSSDLSLGDEPQLDKPSNPMSKHLDLFGPPNQHQAYPQPVHRSPPPLPYIPSPQKTFPKKPLLPPTYHNSNSTHKLTYPERENFPWNENIPHPLDGMASNEGRVMHRVVEIIPQPVTKSQSAMDLFQTELPENSMNAERSAHMEKLRYNNNPTKTESLLNIYTPVYHQHRILSRRIPSTISPLAAIPPSFMPNNNRELMSLMPAQNNRESTTLQIESMKDLSPRTFPYNIKGDFYNPNPSWNNHLNAPLPGNNNRNFTLPSTSHLKGEYLPSPLSHVTKPDVILNKSIEKSSGCLLNSNIKTAPVSVIKTTNSAEGGSDPKPPGEKNKVKFSDTVTVAVVPEINRKERRLERVGGPRNFSGPGGSIGHLDPQRELADSLPLCHPHHDYLKDFAPQLDNDGQEKPTKIKVVHFGVV